MSKAQLKQKEKLKKLMAEGKCILPDNWKKMSVGKQCEYLDGLLKQILEYDEDFDISVTLQCSSKNTYAFVQFTDEGCTGAYEPHYVRCHLVRRDPNVTLADLPEPFQKWAKYEYGEEDADQETVDVELYSNGKTISEALENLFYRIILLFYGYECLYYHGDYTAYCEENNED